MIRRSSPPRRRSPLASGGPPKRRTSVKKVNVKRKAANFARCYHSVERVEFVKSLKCIATGCYGTDADPIENAHIETDGMSRKAPYTRIVPLLRSVHQFRSDSLHALNRAGFERHWFVDLRAAAVMTEAKWIAHSVKLSVENDVSKC